MFTGKVDHLNPLNSPGKGRLMAPLSGGDFRGALGAAQANVKAVADGEHEDLAAGAMPLKPMTPGEGMAQGPALRPLSAMENIPGLKGVRRPLEPLSTERHPAMPLTPLGPKDSIPGVRRSKSSSQEDEVEATARKWVAQTFYGTLFKQMRESPFKSKLFDGGRGGQAFAPMLDQHLVDRMASGTDKKLTNAIAKRLMGKRGGASGGVRTAKSGAIRPAESEMSSETQLSPSSVQPGPAAPGGFEGIRIHVPPGLRA